MIQESLRKIKEAVYGKDVRQAIYDAINQCYEDGKASDFHLIELDEVETMSLIVEDEPVVDNPTITTYSITNTLTNVINDNKNTSINKNSSYTAILNATNGYTLEKVAVTMNGVDITSSAYSNGTINISSVTGNIVIVASAFKEEVTYGGTGTLVKRITNNDVDYLEFTDVTKLITEIGKSTFSLNETYSNDTYKVYETQFLNTWFNVTNSDVTNGLMHTVTIDTLIKFRDDTTEGDLVGPYQGKLHFRVPANLGGCSTVEEYIQTTYGHLYIALISTIKEKIINPSLITTMSIKTASTGYEGQYAQFGYSDLPSANIYTGYCSLACKTGTNANMSGQLAPRFCMSTSTLSCKFALNTFEEFTVENVKQYLTDNPLIFWYV